MLHSIRAEDGHRFNIDQNRIAPIDQERDQKRKHSQERYRDRRGRRLDLNFRINGRFKELDMIAYGEDE